MREPPGRARGRVTSWARVPRTTATRPAGARPSSASAALPGAWKRPSVYNARFPVKVTHEPRNYGVRPPRPAGKLSIRVPAHPRPGLSALTGSAGAEPLSAPRPPCLPVADGRFRARAPRRSGPRCAALGSDSRAAPRSRVPAAATSSAFNVAPPRARRLAPRADQGLPSRGRRSLASP